MNTPFGTMETRDKQWPHKPLGWGKGFTRRFKINRGGGEHLFFVIVMTPPPPFINFLNFTREYKKVYKYFILLVFCYYKCLCNILEIPMLSKVNNVFKDNPIFASSLFYFVPTPPTFKHFQNP